MAIYKTFDLSMENQNELSFYSVKPLVINNYILFRWDVDEYGNMPTPGTPSKIASPLEITVYNSYWYDKEKDNLPF